MLSCGVDDLVRLVMRYRAALYRGFDTGREAKLVQGDKMYNMVENGEFKILRGNWACETLKDSSYRKPSSCWVFLLLY